MEKNDKSFLGTGWSFPPSFSANTADVQMQSGEEDIRQSLAILLSTQLGERFLQPEFGCNLQAKLFEPLNISTQTAIIRIVENAILYFEPRILLNKLTFIDDTDPNGKVNILIDYTISATNTRNNYVFPFYKVEGTNIEK